MPNGHRDIITKHCKQKSRQARKATNFNTSHFDKNRPKRTSRVHSRTPAAPHTPCLKKHLPLTCYNFGIHDPIIILFGRSDTEKVRNPTMLSPLPSNRHHRSCGDCLDGKGENYQVCSVQYCVQQLCTVQCTHI